MNQFTVFYNDDTQFTGDPFKSDWKKLDDTKQIIKLEYMLGNFCIVMQGFKQYNHLLECVALGVKKITKVLLMGRQEGDTLIIVFDLKSNKIYKQSKPYGEEYGKQILSGWYAGILNEPKAYFKQISEEGEKR